MKTFVVLAALFCSTSAFAVSLEDAWSAQAQETIAPVKIGDLFVVADEGDVMGLSNSSEVCGSLGYTRVVHLETENCAIGDKAVDFYSGAKASIFSKPRSCTRGMLRLKSVTCAR